MFRENTIRMLHGKFKGEHRRRGASFQTPEHDSCYWVSKTTRGEAGQKEEKNDTKEYCTVSGANHNKGGGRRHNEDGASCKKLTWKEMQNRRGKGLCYTCDEPFVLGHKYKSVNIYMLNKKETPTPKEDEETSEEEEVATGEELGVSIQALEGGGRLVIMRMKGRVDDHRVSIPMDSGSTHNFINPEVANLLSLKPSPDAGFKVIIADGNKLQCTEVLRSVPILI